MSSHYFKQITSTFLCFRLLSICKRNSDKASVQEQIYSISDKNHQSIKVEQIFDLHRLNAPRWVKCNKLRLSCVLPNKAIIQ